MKGWYLATGPFRPAVSGAPDPRPPDGSIWPQACWLFIADYLRQRYGSNWCLAPEPSLAIQVGDWTLPTQLVIRTPAGSNKPTVLPGGHSLLDLRLQVADADVETRVGLRVMNLPAALMACPTEHFRQRPAQLRAGLCLLTDPEPLLLRLHAGGHSRIAGRLAGALRNVGRDDVADRIRDRLRSRGQRVSEADPFDQPTPALMRRRAFSPYPSPPSLRQRWQALRERVLAARPDPPRSPVAADPWIARAGTAGAATAAMELDGLEAEPSEARYRAGFEVFLDSARRVLNGAAAGRVAVAGLPHWYRTLSGADYNPLSSLPDGYRCHPLPPRRSAPPAPRHEAVRDLIPELFRLLDEEPDPFAAAVLGFLNVLEIQPYAAANGVIGTWLMNLMLASGGYPYSVLTATESAELTAALTAARLDENAAPLAALMSRAVVRSTA